MATSRKLRVVGALAAALLIVITPAQALAAQASTGTYLEIESDSGGQVMTLKISLGRDALRMDAEMQGGVSIVSTGGESGKMVMMMHATKQYVEVSTETLAGMAGMLGQAQPDIEKEIANATPPTFTRTGNTKQVGEWSAYEVLVEHPDQEDTTTMWFSQDVDADFRTLGEQVMNSMSSLLDSPIMQMVGSGSGGGNMFDEIESQLNAVDMPDGFPVQIISGAGGRQSTITLKSINQEASFDAATWQAPEGYSKMAMPFGR